MSKDTEVLDIVYQMMPDGIIGDLMTGSDSNLEVIMRACYNSEVLNLAEYRALRWTCPYVQTPRLRSVGAVCSVAVR